VRKRILCLSALAAFVMTSDRVDAQIHVEGNGNIGYTVVDLVDWRGQGAFGGERLLYGSDVAVVFGRRYGRGLQLALDFGYQHLVDFNFVVDGVPKPFTANVYRAGLTTRFWFQQGAWFGEAGFGAFRFADRTDPSITGGFGTLVEIGDRLAIPLRARAAVVFSSTSQIVPLWLSTGLSYRLRS
jgi:hypothetical protein